MRCSTSCNGALAQHAPLPQQQQAAQGTLLVPMAGLGQRFAREGYTRSKPLIPVSGLPMVLQAAQLMPPARQHCFVLRQDMPELDAICHTLRQQWPQARLQLLPGLSEGQADSALAGLQGLQAALAAQGQSIPGPLTIAACDLGVLYDPGALQAALADCDLLVWTVRGHPHAQRQPQMYGWLQHDGQGRVLGVSVKQALADPAHDPQILGCFTLRDPADLARLVARLHARAGRVNGEFYLDSCIEDALALGLRCRLFDVSHYLSWGTPDDLRTFNYWQSCFHQWPGHPYRLQHDALLPAEAVAALAAQYADFDPGLPAMASASRVLEAQ